MNAVSYNRPNISTDSNPESILSTSSRYSGQAGVRQATGNGHQYPTSIGAAAIGPSDPAVSNIVNQLQGLNVNGPGMAHPGPGMQLNGPPTYMLSLDGQYMLAHMAGPAHSMHMENYGSAAGPYVPGPGHFGNFGVSVIPYTPGRATAIAHRNDRGSEVPALENRRGSYSTNESTPATPFYAGVAPRDSGPRVAGLDRSTYTTPSPQQANINVLQAIDPNKGAAVIPLAIDRNLDELLKKDPAVPKAVPAVFTPPGQMKSVDQSLENRISGNRNVYIRGLHPTTDDALLYAFTSRFGAVETSKAIIDTATGACKGFGFAKFYDVRHSELCIRGFHRLGYEVGFARESFNSRLKAEGDDNSTNLYISNLPKNVGEVELGTIFLGFEILSSKILRDSMGNSRGVGFARFASRDVCDAIIKEFHGKSIGDEGLMMNIRYADTPAQKELKRVTAERRQFRTNEYNIGAYGTPLVGYSPNMYGGPQPWRRPASTQGGHSPRVASTTDNGSASATGSSLQGGGVGSHRRAQYDIGVPLPDCYIDHGQRLIVARTSSDAAIVTPTSSEPSDEGVTIHAESTVVIGSTQSSPAVKKEK